MGCSAQTLAMGLRPGSRRGAGPKNLNGVGPGKPMGAWLRVTTVAWAPEAYLGLGPESQFL